jgi:hypothetical protein
MDFYIFFLKFWLSSIAFDILGGETLKGSCLLVKQQKLFYRIRTMMESLPPVAIKIRTTRYNGIEKKNRFPVKWWITPPQTIRMVILPSCQNSTSVIWFYRKTNILLISQLSKHPFRIVITFCSTDVSCKFQFFFQVPSATTLTELFFQIVISVVIVRCDGVHKKSPE